MVSKDIQSIVSQALSELGYALDLVQVSVSDTKAHGDWSTNVALILSKKLKKKPVDLATEITHKISEKKYDLLEKVEVLPPGFINFFLSKKYFLDTLSSIRRESESYGSSGMGTGKKVIVEYSSPNIAKPFTIGHLRSTIIGDAIANLYAFQGFEVLRDNHLGDWGTQFGKLIVAMKELGQKERNEELLEQSDNPVKLLVDLYVEFHKQAEENPELEEKARDWFARLENGDPEARRIWQKCVHWSLLEFEKIYRRLSVDFGIPSGKIGEAIGKSIFPESFFEKRMDAVLTDLKQKNLVEESQGALLVMFPSDEFPPLMVRKKDGATLYATRDLATDKFRFETFGKDITVINEVGAEQKMYFQQLFTLEEMLGYCKKSQRIHVAHGLIRFKEGKMSTRKGNTIWLEQVLDEAVRRASEINKESAEVVGIGAIKFNDLKRACEKEVLFDWDELLNLKGNTGPYIQYAYARTQSVLEKSQVDTTNLSVQEISLSEVEKNVLRELSQFPEILQSATTNLAPHELCTYLFSVAQAFNTFYAECSILHAQHNEKEFRLLLTYCVSVVLKNGLNILGIKVLSSM